MIIGKICETTVSIIFIRNLFETRYSENKDIIEFFDYIKTLLTSIWENSEQIKTNGNINNFDDEFKILTEVFEKIFEKVKL